MVMIGGIMMSLVPAVLERFAAPTYPELVSSIGWFLIILLPLTAVLAIFSLPERESANRPRLGLKRGAAIVFKNMALLRLLIVNALLTFSTYFVQGLFVFFVSYSLGLEDRIGFILGFLIVGGLIGLPVWLRIAQTWNKHRAMQIAVSTGAIAPLVLLALPPGYLLLTVAAFLVVGLNTSANEFLPRTMMADVCDQDHVESGSERMGLYYSAAAVIEQAGLRGRHFVGFLVPCRIRVRSRTWTEQHRGGVAAPALPDCGAAGAGLLHRHRASPGVPHQPRKTAGDAGNHRETRGGRRPGPVARGFGNVAERPTR